MASPIPMIASWLSVVERIAITSAAVFAIIPIWQFISESPERELERAANFISAYRACFGEDGILIEERIRSQNSMELNEIVRQVAERVVLRSRDAAVDQELHNLSARARIIFERANQNMIESCNRLDRLYMDMNR